MRLFISYAHEDKAIVRDWIVSKLLVGGHDVWFDDRLVAGQDWIQQLSDKIQRSDALVYAMTPESVASQWCQWELAKAVDLGKPVVPVLIQARTQLPIEIKQLQYVDFSDGPTVDAVERLMGGLQQLSPDQIPLAPTSPQGLPPQAFETASPSLKHLIVRILSHPATHAIVGIIGVLIAVVALLASSSGGSNPEPTPTSELPTPMTPIVVALRDLDIRDGPDVGYPRLNILPIGGVLDILGISEDRLWYQVLLSDGRRGWVLSTSTGVRLEGDRGVVQMIIPTLTPSLTPTAPPSPTQSPSDTQTNLPTDTLSPTNTETHTSTPALTDTPRPSDTPTPNSEPSATVLAAQVTPSLPLIVTQDVPSYPCNASIVYNRTGLLNIVRGGPSSRSSYRAPIQQGAAIRILSKDQESRDVFWYRIADADGNELGWIEIRYAELSENCPR